MSFWKFIGGFALFSLICDAFSGNGKRIRGYEVVDDDVYADDVYVSLDERDDESAGNVGYFDNEICDTEDSLDYDW